MEIFARINGCGLGPRYDDDAFLYHPYDLLIAKHFPDVDIPSLLFLDWIRYIYRAILREEIPEMIPKTWRNPPPRPPEELQPAVEGYRSRLLAKIESRIKQYSYEPSTAPKIPKITLSGSPRLSSSAGDVAEHPALQVPEILWTILEFGTAETHLAAFDTSKRWRAVVKMVMKPYYRAFPCGPVGYGEYVAPDLSWRQPSMDELRLLKQDVADWEASNYPLWKNSKINADARLFQARGLDRATATTIRSTYYRLHYTIQPPFPSDTNKASWLDLSQFEINPYLKCLLPDFTNQTFGWIQMDLQPGWQKMLMGKSTSQEYLDCISPMFVTQPPCKILTIYIDTASTSLQEEEKEVTVWMKIEDPDGVRIGQFLKALQETASIAFEQWKKDVQVMRRHISECRWTCFSWPNRSLGEHVFLASDRPRLFIALDNEHKDAYRWALPFMFSNDKSHFRAQWGEHGVETVDPGTFFGRAWNPNEFRMPLVNQWDIGDPI